MRRNASPARTPARECLPLAPRRGSTRANAACCSSGSIVDAHRRAPLAAVRSSASILRSTQPSTRSTWSARSGFEQQQRRGRCGASPCSGKKCGSRAATIAFDREPARVAVVGMEAVRRPRIVRRARRRAGLRGSPRTTARACAEIVRRARRRRAEEVRRRARRARRRVSLLRLARRDQRGEVGVGVPRALGAVGADAQVHVGAGVRPLRERRAAAELDVVGVGADREHAAAATGEVDAWSRAVGDSRRARSSGSVDVEAERVVAHDPHARGRRAGRFGAVPRERTRRRTRTRTAPSTGSAQHRCPVVAVVGDEHRDRCARRRRRRRRASSRTAGRRARRRRGRALRRASTCRPASAARVERAGIVERAPARARVAPRRDFGRARHDDDGPRRRGGDDRVGHASRESDAGVVVERGREAALPNGTNGSGRRPRRRATARRRRSASAWRAYATGRGRPLLRGEGRLLPRPALRAAVDDRGRGAHPAPGPVILASNHISYLDPLTLAYVADQRGAGVRFLAKAELFDKRGLGVAAAGRAPDPGAARHQRRRVVARRRGRRARPRRVRRGVPRGHDLARPRADGRQVGHRAARARRRRRR